MDPKPKQPTPEPQEGPEQPEQEEDWLLESYDGDSGDEAVRLPRTFSKEHTHMVKHIDTQLGAERGDINV